MHSTSGRTGALAVAGAEVAASNGPPRPVHRLLHLRQPWAYSLTVAPS
ncbi:hypothetical protein AB0H36_00220 [Kribbella sp. NPDC050820]